MTATNLPFVQQEMIRYGMTVYLGLGLVGNVCNCIMFTRRRYLQTASSIYLFSLSIFAIIYLLWSIVPLIYALNRPDPQTQSLLYCKLRLYVTHILGQYIRYCLVFACIDRYLITKAAFRFRSLSSVQMAIKVVFIICLVCAMIAIHLPILTELTGGICGTTGIYKLIYAVYQIVIVGILPPVLMSIFSILTIRHLHERHAGTQVHARQRDRYLTRMLVAEVIVNISTSIPYSVSLLYGAVTYNVADKSAERLEIEAFCSFVALFVIYLISVAPFYLFIITSKPFRNDFMNLFFYRWNQFIRRRRQRRIQVDLSDEQNMTTVDRRAAMHNRH